MSDPIFLKSPYEPLISGAGLPPEAVRPAPVVEVDDAEPDAEPAPAPAAPASTASTAKFKGSKDLTPPPELRPLFEGVAAHFKVPPNVLMALAQHESRYNSTIRNPETDAGGMAQYMAATAKSLGINRDDPNEAIPAMAMQLRERLDKGMSMQDAIKEHFAGPDRKLWGPKTAAYGDEVMGKARVIGEKLYSDGADAAPAPQASGKLVDLGDAPAGANLADAPNLTPEHQVEEVPPTPGPTRQNKFSAGSMGRAEYQRNFIALNPRVTPGALDAAMAQYDQQADAAAQATQAKAAKGPKGVPTTDEFFQQRLDAKLAAKNPRAGGIAPDVASHLPVERAHTQTIKQRTDEQLDYDLAIQRGENPAPLLPSNVNPADYEALRAKSPQLGRVTSNLIAGAAGTVGGAMAAGFDMAGDHDTAKFYDELRAQLNAEAQKKGGDTIIGKTANLAGAIAPAAASGSAGLLGQLATNLGLFGVSAFRDTYKAQKEKGASDAVAIEHSLASAGINTALPMIAPGGSKALTKLLGAADLAGARAAGVQLGQAGVEGLGFSGANIVADKGIDAANGVENNTPIDPASIGKDAAAFMLLRAGHMAPHATGAAADAALNRMAPGYQVGRALQEDVAATHFGADSARQVAAERLAASNYDPRAIAPQDTARQPGDVGPAPTTRTVPMPPPEQAAPPAPSAPVDIPAQAGARIEPTLDAPAEAPPAAPAAPATPGRQSPADRLRAIRGEADGVQVVPEPPAGPLTAALHVAAAEHAVNPAPLPEVPQAQPAPPALDTLPMEELQARLKDVATQQKAADPDGRKALQVQRKEIEKAINAKAASAKADSRPAEEPLTTGPFEDMGQANKMMARHAEATGAPHEVVPDADGFRVQRIEGDGNGNAGRDVDGRGRGDRPADAAGAPDAGAPVRAGSGSDGRADTGASDGPGGRSGGDGAAGADRAGEPAAAVAGHAPVHLVRMSNAKNFDWNREKPNGTYASVASDPATFKSPFADDYKNGQRHDLAYTPTNPLEVGGLKVKHQRFGRFGEGEASAGVQALHAYLPRAEFDAALRMDKGQVQAEIAKRFPDVDASKANDAYEALEIWGAQEAKAKGHDIIIAHDRDVPQFSEAVLLNGTSKPKDSAAHVPEPAKVPEEAPAAKSTEGEKPAAADDDQAGAAGKAAAPAAAKPVTLKDGSVVTLHNEHINDAMSLVTARSASGKEIGTLAYSRQDGVNPGVDVNAHWRRKGLATAMYDHAEENGGKIPAADAEGTNRTPDGMAFREARAARKEAAPQPAAAEAPAPTKPATTYTAGDRMRARVKAENPFMAFLSEHGIHIDERSDTGAEKARHVMVPGYGNLYRKAGLRIDELANLAHEAGFLSDRDMANPTDNDGTRKLADMIERAAHRKEVIGRATEAEPAGPSADEQLMAEAEKLGIDVKGKSADQVYDEVVAAHADDYSQNEAELQREILHDADIPFDLDDPRTTRGRQLNNEELDEIFGTKSQAAGEGQTGREDQGAAAGASAGRDAEAGAAREGDDADLLKSYTPDEIRAREEAQDAIAKAAEKEARERDAAEKKARDDKDIAARMDATVDNFQLGQSADDALAGQKGLLDDGPRYSVSDERKTVQVDGKRRPIENSNGKPIAEDAHKQMAFWRWAGDTKVVDEQGRPLVVYHGTAKDFSEFDPDAQAYGNPAVDNGLQFFTTNPREASGYARIAGADARGAGANVMPVYLRIRDPLRVDIEGSAAEHWDQHGDDIRSQMDAGNHDGIILQGTDAAGTMYITCDPGQIKSATGNSGKFDPANADIRYSTDHPMAAEATREVEPVLQSLADKGAIVLHDDASTLPVKGEAPRGVQALTTADGTIHVVASALHGNAMGVVLHEAFHAGARPLLGTKVWGDLEQRLGSLYRQGEQSAGRAREFFDAARERVESAKARGAVKEGMEAEEFGAYAIEEYANAPTTVKKWVDDVVGHVKAWALRRFGKQFGDVTPAQLSSIARLALMDKVKGSEAPAERLAPAFSADADQGAPPAKPADDASNAEKQLYVIRTNKDSLLKAASAGWREVMMFADPMSRGAMKAQRAASDYERALVKSNNQWNAMFRQLTKDFTPEQLRDMWDAGDEQNVLMQQGLPTAGKGIDRLPPEQREVSLQLHQYGNDLLAKAKAVGMFEGEGLPYWTTRMSVQIGEDGDVSRLVGGGFRGAGGGRSKEAVGFTSSASSLKQRKHLTTDETEAAATYHAEDGKKAVVVRDIRTNILAMARLEKAIAGRSLLNHIKTEGLLTGEELVGGDGENFTEVHHPAFTRWTPEMVKNEAGEWEPRLDQNGQPMMMSSYLKIHKDWEGPLRAVLGKEMDFKNLYKGYMRLKAESMNFNMASPLIHNMVILGRAAAYGKPVLTALHAYAVGRKLREDYQAQNEMIARGMNPIGNHGFAQDITGMAAGEAIEPGRSLTAKAISSLVGAINKSAGDKTARALDKAGDFWHGTLLWNMIGDLQRGLYVHMKAAKLRDGLDDVAAGEFAGHFANRFAGSIRNSAMSAGARQLLNVSLFSRSFTAGNLGIVKDMFQGVPSDSYAQVLERSGPEMAKRLVSSGRKEAMSAFVKDYGLALVSTNLIAATLLAWQADDLKKGISDVAGQYRDNYLRMLKMGGEHWTHWMDPWFVPDQLSLLSKNEPGRTDRPRTGTEADGTAIYTRVPSGKVPEEIRNWIERPVTTLTSKLAPLPKSIWESATNKVGTFDKPLYPEKAHWYEKVMPMMGHVLASQIPLEVIQSHMAILSGDESKPTNKGLLKTAERQKAAGFWTGFSTSHGYPGGPEAGARAEIDRDYSERVGLAKPAIKDALKHGNKAEAERLMKEAGMTPRDMAMTPVRVEHPGIPSKKAIKQAVLKATPEQQEKLIQQMKGGASK